MKICQRSGQALIGTVMRWSFINAYHLLSYLWFWIWINSRDHHFFFWEKGSCINLYLLLWQNNMYGCMDGSMLLRISKCLKVGGSEYWKQDHFSNTCMYLSLNNTTQDIWRYKSKVTALLRNPESTCTFFNYVYAHKNQLPARVIYKEDIIHDKISCIIYLVFAGNMICLIQPCRLYIYKFNQPILGISFIDNVGLPRRWCSNNEEHIYMTSSFW